jgi:phosphatidylserine decarboxylase
MDLLSRWMFKLSEWASFSTYDVGRANTGHILVFDRRTKRLVEELIDMKIVLSMRAIYQSKAGLALIDVGTKNLLQSISEKQGRHMKTAESKKDIPKFIEFFKVSMTSSYIMWIYIYLLGAMSFQICVTQIFL